MIRFHNARIPMGRDKRLHIANWTLLPGELWVIAGAGGTGKSSLARAVAGVADASGRFPRISGLERCSPTEGEGAWISFDREREIRALLRRDDNSEWSGRPDEGTTLDTFLGGQEARDLISPDLLKKLEGRGIKHLSTGEFRQVLIASEAARHPALAVLDEPFEGLDVQARSRLTMQLTEWSCRNGIIVLTVNRREDVPDFASGIVLLNDSGVAAVGEAKKILQSPEATAALGINKGICGHVAATNTPHSETSQSSEKRWTEATSKHLLPPKPFECASFSGPLIEMKNVSLAYDGRSVLEGIDWTVLPGDSWLLTGPNGSGKTTLLNLINGDEPRGFGQDLWIFGKRKGSGESIAEIKRNLGHVSASLQESASRHATPLEIVGSGLRDSLVISPPLNGYENDLVRRWLEVVGLAEAAEIPFFRLPYGERRLAMIVRAMIKHPPLLLLDEPMHGLDSAARKVISSLIDRVIRETKTSVLFVSHRPEDAPDSIINHIRLIPDPGGGPSHAQTEGRRSSSK